MLKRWAGEGKEKAFQGSKMYEETQKGKTLLICSMVTEPDRWVEDKFGE